MGDLGRFGDGLQAGVSLEDSVNMGDDLGRGQTPEEKGDDLGRGQTPPGV